MDPQAHQRYKDQEQQQYKAYEATMFMFQSCKYVLYKVKGRHNKSYLGYKQIEGSQWTLQYRGKW